MERHNPDRSRSFVPTLEAPVTAVEQRPWQVAPDTAPDESAVAAGSITDVDRVAAPIPVPSFPSPPFPEPNPCAVLQQAYDHYQRRLERLKAGLKPPIASPDTALTTPAQVPLPHPKQKAAPPVQLLHGTRSFLQCLEHPPLLPPPRHQDFEAAFKRHEPMFHAVFYRKYAPAIRDDAKQEALLALYRKWLKNRAILEQSSSYVVQAAIYGVSNWRKKGMKVRSRGARLVVDVHGKVVGEPRSHAHERWTDRIDLRLDVARAVESVHKHHQGGKDRQGVAQTLRHVCEGVPFKRGQQASGLPFRAYKQQREQVKAELRAQLAEYAQPLASDRADEG